ncbi:MAG: DUF721 domain-containing protein [Spirochaetales bacterium]|nr:DUF721 domain-containing protein [Spirochaetales bacterium]
MDKAGDLLKKFSIFSSADDPHAGEYSRIFSSWEKIAGQKLSQYSRIVDIDNHSLLIEADHPAIIQLLQLKYREILDKIRRKYPQLQISDLRMFVKNPEYRIQRNERNKASFPGDETFSSGINTGNNENFEKIDDENFRDLLRDMKKRSQL